MSKRLIEEAALISECKKGDMTALAHIARMYRVFMYKTALGLLGNSTSANELVIVTIVKFWNDRRLIKTDTSLKTYFYNSLYEVARGNPALFDLGIKTKLETAMLDKGLSFVITEEIIERERKMILS